jgi:hypothetical protein
VSRSTDLGPLPVAFGDARTDAFTGRPLGAPRTLLTTVSLPVYLGAHQIAGWCWVGGGVALSVTLCRRRGGALLAAALAGPAGELPGPPIRLVPSTITAKQPVLATLEGAPVDIVKVRARGRRCEVGLPIAVYLEEC